MFKPHWSYQGTLDQICEELHRSHFPPAIFLNKDKRHQGIVLLTVARGPGWYTTKKDTWLLCKPSIDDCYHLYYWQNYDPRPFLRIVTTLKGFK